MKKLLKYFLIICLLLAFKINAGPDLVAPLSFKYLGTSSNKIIDTVEVHTYLQNRGTNMAISPLYPDPYVAVVIGTDSFNIRAHSIYSLSAGYFSEFVDTITCFAGPFSIHAWTDPLNVFSEDNEVNNVYSYGLNYHPIIHYDTITVVKIDTLTLHDTIIIHDTLKITIHDTIIHNDTIVIHDTIISTALNKQIDSRNSQLRLFSGLIYNVKGQKVWEGATLENRLPTINIPSGTYLFVQGDRRKLLKVINMNCHFKGF